MTRSRRRIPPGLEPQPSGGISHLTVLRNRERSVLCLPAGDIDVEHEPASGLYHHDARHLSQLSLRLNDERMLVLDSDERGYALTATLTNPPFELDGLHIPGQTILLRRTRIITEVLSEGVTVSNYGRNPVELELVIALQADFTDIFVIRGYQRAVEPAPVGVEVEGDRLSFRCRGRDDMLRATTCVFDPAPTELDEHGATFRFALDPGGSFATEMTVHVDGEAAVVPTRTASQLAEQRAREWLGRCTSVETDSASLNETITRCLLDIRSLHGTLEGHPFVAAGVPWFDAPFGRDSIITGIEMAAFTTEPLRDALRLLAAYQATSSDAARDSERGKIAHEIRQGELANTNEVPFGRYYGSIDSTPLFLIGALEYVRWTGDRELLHECWEAIEAAARWCHGRAVAHPLHLLAYDRESANGLEHQGWKDSEDGICDRDGTPVTPPVALIEVQAYLVAAYMAYGELAHIAGKMRSFDAHAASRDAHRHLRERFLSEPEPAVCLDRELRPVFCPTSNAGHVLWVGAASHAEAGRIARRLLEPDLFSGWGIRTLAAGIPAYNPLGYHIGSIWPHDNAIILAGFRRYGLLDELRTLGSALVQASLSFPDRHIPELFSGDARDTRAVPTPYPVASRPQAWSAASLPYALMSMLGIGPTAEGGLAITRPVLPDGVGLVVVRGLRFGDSSVDLLFRGDGGHVSVEVDHRRGTGRVVFTPEWPVPPFDAGR